MEEMSPTEPGIAGMDSYEHRLFVYGTLMFAELREMLLGHVVRTEKASLAGYCPFTVRYGSVQSTYPVLKPFPCACTEGMVLSDLQPRDWEKLLFYEGDEYELKKLPVRMGGFEFPIPLFYPRENALLTFGVPWSRQDFERQHLNNYLQDVIPNTLLQFPG